MPADDATGPTGRAASIGFYANADDSPRVAGGIARTPRRRPAERPRAAAVAPHRSGLIVALATVLLAGTAIGFAWTLTPAGRPTPDSGPATALPVQRPAEAPAAAELQPPAPNPAVSAPEGAPAAASARHRRTLTAAQPSKPAAHHPGHAAAHPHRSKTDLADAYARAMEDLDQRRAQAAGGDPPF